MLTTEQLTLQDFLRLPRIEESPAWEFVEGKAEQKTMPTLHHSMLQKRLTALIDRLNSPYEAFPELRCTLSNSSVVPDITIVHRDRIPLENTAIAGAPDWTIEILSPEQSTTKLIAKIQTCMREGTQLGWLIDSSEQVIMVLFPDLRVTLCQGSDRLPTLPDISLDLMAEQVFDLLRAPQ
ncbi:Uma2 family endonuclease [Pseudanabaena sp. PCC 6802]|uniref:Uma2 family endonuclease n=1 Tax=Pseudanabaena sp. PCC 6802 TaxID=118173 RepID=UPI00034BFAE7|nr:Uma2 family endonuclease [Pseudanabaena sp. PCC 6802]